MVKRMTVKDFQIKKIDGERKIYSKESGIWYDKDSLVELIVRDTDREILEDTLGTLNREDLMEEDFEEIAQEKLRKWNLRSLLYYYLTYRYK